MINVLIKLPYEILLKTQHFEIKMGRGHLRFIMQQYVANT